MSHSSRNFAPPFNFVVEEPYSFDGQVPQLTIDTTQQWLSSGPRSVQHQMPSPSTSVRTVMTAPDLGSYNRPSFHANRSPIENNIDPNLPDNLSLLAPPAPISRSSYNPIARHLQDQPWSAGNLRSTGTSGGRSPLSQPNVQYGSYRGALGPGSDIDSHVLPSDSGYHSQPPQSVFSNDQGQISHDAPSHISYQVRDINVESTPSEALPIARLHSDQISQISSRSGKSGKAIQCPECDETSKCRSDFKKHILKHKKPFKCDVPNCKRAGQGFTTINDLDRHKKSVHRIGLRTKSYQCAAANCRNKEKIWPRLDNFKQHIDRMHGDEDDLDLIKRSMFRAPQRAPAVESRTVTPMDTNLAVAGMEKSFSDNPTLNTVPSMELPLDQDASRWPSLRKGVDSFAKDVCHMPTHFNTSSAVERGACSEGLQESAYIYQRASGAIARRESQALLANSQAHIVSEQPVSKTQEQKAHPLLSNAPQTKAEQQRSTFQRLSQVISDRIQSSSSHDSVNLEDLVLRILHEATDSASGGWDDKTSEQTWNTQQPQTSNNPVTLTKGEALKASQAISKLIKQCPESTYIVQRRSAPGFISNAKVCPRAECDYTGARDCDLRKHMKRHDKPYGCTYPNCHKRFGAKSDWKRHENSQHFQLEAFRCAQPALPKPGSVDRQTSSQAACGRHFTRAGQLEDHLATQHNMSNLDQLKESLKMCKIGKNCQGSFWCGFCGRVMILKQKGNAAWSERFDHIAHHFEKDKKNIDEWICAEENKSKKELSDDIETYVFDDEDEKEDETVDIDAAGDVDDDVSLSPLNVPEEMSTRKRKASADPPAPQRPVKQAQARMMTNRYCVSVRRPGALCRLTFVVLMFKRPV
ncbi:Nn.00g054490.m01.CDS01 [Neocucurbitaria sp. VM-36]